MPDPDKAFRQDVHGKATYKFVFREFTNLFPASFPIVFYRKAYAILPDIHDPVIADGDLMGVTPQIFGDLLRSPKGSFSVYHPWFGS